MELLYPELTQQIIEAFYKVYNTLGSGFLESVYQNALYFELTKNIRLQCIPQYDIDVYYEDVVVGKFRADLVVEDKVILELKATSELTESHSAQLLNYLKATKYEVGLLLNFGPNPKVVRRVLTNSNK